MVAQGGHEPGGVGHAGHELVAGAALDDAAIHAARAEIYVERRNAEGSLMSKGIFMAAARESQSIVEASTPQ